MRALVALLALTVFTCSRDRGFTEPLTGIRFVPIPAGSFVMGSTPDEPGHLQDETAHRVTISRRFYMSATEVTQKQWQTIMGRNPSAFPQSGPNGFWRRLFL